MTRKALVGAVDVFLLFSPSYYKLVGIGKHLPLQVCRAPCTTLTSTLLCNCSFYMVYWLALHLFVSKTSRFSELKWPLPRTSHPPSLVSLPPQWQTSVTHRFKTLSRGFYTGSPLLKPGFITPWIIYTSPEKFRDCFYIKKNPIQVPLSILN